MCAAAFPFLAHGNRLMIVFQGNSYEPRYRPARTQHGTGAVGLQRAAAKVRACAQSDARARAQPDGEATPALISSTVSAGSA